MKKDIKISIIMLIISVILLSFGILVTTSKSFSTFFYGNSLAVTFVPALVTGMCLFCGFIGTMASIVMLITFIYLDHINKRAEKRQQNIKAKIKTKLPKGTEFSVSINNFTDEELNKLLLDNIRCTAFFDGSSICFNFSLPSDIKLETKDIAWFDKNFKY